MAVNAPNAAAPAMDFTQYQRMAEAMGIQDFSGRLIHYTPLETFERIITSRELWFGSLTNMNDTAECNHFLDGILQHLSNLVPADPATVAQLVGLFRAKIRTETFISSWCEYNEPDGKLLMWREYARGGSGVGLVMDSSQFQPSAIRPENLGFHVFSTKMDYVADDRVTAHAAEAFRRLASLDFIRDAQPLEKLNFLTAFLLVKAPCVKHQSYSDEGEIRFLRFRGLMPFPNDVIRHAVVDGVAREFFALPLRQYPQAGFDFRIEEVLRRVVVGPSGDKAARAARVREVLDNNGLGHVEVGISGIPMR